eukprot:484140-Pelagomonas_calceolata.AAC.12
MALWRTIVSMNDANKIYVPSKGTELEHWWQSPIHKHASLSTDTKKGKKEQNRKDRRGEEMRRSIKRREQEKKQREGKKDQASQESRMREGELMASYLH